LERSDRIETDIKRLKVEHKEELKNQEIRLKEEFNEERKQLNAKIRNLETKLEVATAEIKLLHNLTPNQNNQLHHNQYPVFLSHMFEA